MRVIPFRSLPYGAKRLILYYSIVEPGLVGFIIFNAYLFKLGYSVLYVGSIISVASLISALLIPLLGYLSDKKINAKYFMIILEALLGISFIIYGLAQNGVEIFVGRVIFSASMLFTFTSNVYEKELYPEEILEDAYVWHWIIPSIAGIITYIGAFIYFSFFPEVEAMRLYYIIFGAMAPVFMGYIYFALPDMPIYRKRETLKIPKRLLLVFAVVVLANFTSYFIYGISIDNLIINHFGAGVAMIILLSLIENIIAFVSSTLKAHIPTKFWSTIPFIAMFSLGFVAFLIFIVGIIHKESLLILFIFYTVLYFFWPLWHMSFKPILIGAIPKQYRGTIFSSISSMLKFINIPLAFITGIIITFLGPFSPALFASIFAFSTAAILKIIKK